MYIQVCACTVYTIYYIQCICTYEESRRRGPPHRVVALLHLFGRLVCACLQFTFHGTKLIRKHNSMYAVYVCRIHTHAPRVSAYYYYVYIYILYAYTGSCTHGGVTLIFIGRIAFLVIFSFYPFPPHATAVRRRDKTIFLVSRGTPFITMYTPAATSRAFSYFIIVSNIK